MLLQTKDSSGQQHFDVACEFKLLKADTPGTIEGYGSVFNLIDRGGDVVMPGAFAKSIAELRRKGEPLPMLWQHDPRAPIGVWTDLAENDKGLKVKGELILDVPQASTAHALLKRGALKGLSIGFMTKEADVDRQTGARRLKRVDLWEISLVTFPMMPEAQLTGIKTEFDAPAWERAYRDGGLSNREAKLATSIARNMVLRDGERPEPPQRDAVRDVLMSMRKASTALR